MKMQTYSKSVRYNYNVPRKFVNDLKRIAAQRGIQPSWWLYKVIERAIEEENKQPVSNLPNIDFSDFESFTNQ